MDQPAANADQQFYGTPYWRSRNDFEDYGRKFLCWVCNDFALLW